MAKIYAKIRNENGKIRDIGGNEYLDIDIQVGNVEMASFTLKRCDTMEEDGMDGKSGWVLYDNNDAPLYWIEDKEKGNKQKSEICRHCGKVHKTDPRTGFEYAICE